MNFSSSQLIEDMFIKYTADASKVSRSEIEDWSQKKLLGVLSVDRSTM